MTYSLPTSLRVPLVSIFFDADVDASNVLSGGSGDDSLSASIEIASGSSLSGLDITNTLDGGIGNDHLEASIDMVPPQEGPQLALENHLEGGAGDDVLLATIVDTTTGSSFLDGGNGNDQLKVVGGSANVLNGGDGRDSLTGGTGNDFLFGGKAADTFHFDLSANQGTDTIGDFERERDILSFAGVTDHGTPGLADDLDAISTITDLGAGNDVAVDFTSGSHHRVCWSRNRPHRQLERDRCASCASTNRLIQRMRAFGPYWTSLVAPHMSAFRIRFRDPFAVHMSACDPKRTYT